jgi:hypothetical protein
MSHRDYLFVENLNNNVNAPSGLPSKLRVAPMGQNISIQLFLQTGSPYGTRTWDFKNQ